MENLLLVFQNPNIIYLLLLAGLWLAVTAAYTPGTMVIEAISAGTLLLAFYGLGSMPATQWWAVALIVVGVSGFLALPFLSSKWETLAQGGLVLQIIGGLFLFDGQSISPVAPISTVLLAWSYHQFILLPALRRHRKTVNVTESDLLLGARGRVVTPLNPVGTVYVNGELWTARSKESLDTDLEVIITEKVGLELRVEKAKNEERQYSTNGVH